MTAFRLDLVQGQRMEQRLMQSPQMIQAMQILQLPALELMEKIDQEMLENPFLEVLEPESDVVCIQPPDPHADKIDLGDLKRLERLLGESQDRSPRRHVDPDAMFRHDEALQQIPGGEEHTLAEVILAQLHLLYLSERELRIAEYVLYSLDDDGFLREDPETLASGMDLDPTPVELARAIERIREVGPVGVAASGLPACLLLQLQGEGQGMALARRIAEAHLEDLMLNRLPRIAREEEVTIEEVKDAADLVRHLNPRPAAGFTPDHNAVVRPDMVMDDRDGAWSAVLERGDLPRLTISRQYRDLLKEAATDGDVYAFLKKKIDSARWFLDALEQRESTIQRVANEIVRVQADYLDKGVGSLKPLKMQDVADRVGSHISTVSRAIAGKYAQTPHGIVPLKYFFSGGTRTDAGEEKSQRAVMERIRALVETEESERPYSDEEITRRLKQRHGITIARRTVTKYRKSLGIPSSTQRRVY